MLLKQLKATNSNDDGLSFGRHFHLLHGFDLSGLQADISYATSTRDGANYQRTLLSVREFDLSVYLKNRGRERWWVEEKRRELIRVFNPKHNPIRLDFVTQSGESYYIHANLNAVPFIAQELNSDNRAWNRALIQFSCDDPYIYSANTTVEELAAWIPSFEFPLEILEEGIEMGYRSPSLIANVHNDGDSDTGMIIRFKALTRLTNPELINVNTYEKFSINFEMEAGDEIEVSTYIGKKSVTLIRNNIRTNIFNAVDLSSTFLQLSPGDNLFRYNAEIGIDNLEVSMNFTAKWVGL